jgi:ribonuclease T2
MSAKTAVLTASSLIALCVTVSLQAQSSRRHSSQPGAFSYYMLVLSYAPDFCAEPGGPKNYRECGPGRRIGFVVHGLWPESGTGRGPEDCGTVSPVSQAIIGMTLSYIPTESLIQHEWRTHGSCTGLDAASYFGFLRKARDLVRIPPDLDQPSQPLQLSQPDLDGRMAAANSSFPRDAFQLSCYRDDSLQEVRICFNKDLSPHSCPMSAGHCAAPTVTMQPVR